MPRFLLIICLLLTACSGPGSTAPPPEVFDPAGSLGPFVPRQMRIYPLTHVEAGEASRPDDRSRIICHVEFTDRWYDTAKAVGELKIQLYRSGGAGFDVQQAVWNIDLTDLAINAEWFDPVTRTYRIALSLPEWAQNSLGETFRLIVTFTPVGADVRPIEMRDEVTLRSSAPGSPMPDSVDFPDDSADFPRRPGNLKTPAPLDPAQGPSSEEAPAPAEQPR